ncbi:SurA N-terminal domain-containing protein [Nonomuraea sediminis]|uniref:SurA N-terminal domain-containing protein n=1 Tax=Nonomuraea sediminis TaxID=2835864 RepID=UPI001BDBB624|nr:SurA N-terminal domain-containing protein [Nonomuraea sediminis]
MKSIRVALAAAAAGIALTACSSPLQAGAAAVVGDERISADQLNTKVKGFEEALRLAKIEPSQLPLPVNQFVLLGMTNEAAARQLAAKYNMQVTEAEVDAALKDPGQQSSPELNLLSKGVVPTDARGYIRAEVGLKKVVDSLGGQQNQQAMAKLRADFGSIKVVYSPRYGTFDPQQGFIDTGRFGKLEPAPQQQQQQQPQG